MSEWRRLLIEVKDRLLSVFGPARLLYFVFVVVGIGGLGVWLSAADMVRLRANLASYAMGISAAAAVELVLPRATSGALRMLSISLCIVSFCASLLYQSLWPSLVWLAAVFAWLLWILSSSTNVNLGSADPTASTGGSTDTVSGDLTGFSTDAG